MYMIISAILLLLNINNVAGDTSMVIKRDPFEAVRPKGEVTVSCSLSEKSNILWYRKSGSLVTKIAINGHLLDSFSQNSRYYLTKRNIIGKLYQEVLSINDLKYEDIASIGCGLVSTSNTVNYTVVQVCDDIDSSWCQCIGTHGWLDPRCFEMSASVRDEYEKVLTALGICLAIAIIYGIIASLMIGWECIQKTYQRKRKKDELRKSYIAPETTNESDALQYQDENISQNSYDGAPSTSMNANHEQTKNEKYHEPPSRVYGRKNQPQPVEVSQHSYNPAYVHDNNNKNYLELEEYKDSKAGADHSDHRYKNPQYPNDSYDQINNHVSPNSKNNYQNFKSSSNLSNINMKNSIPNGGVYANSSPDNGLAPEQNRFYSSPKSPSAWSTQTAKNPYIDQNYSSQKSTPSKYDNLYPQNEKTLSPSNLKYTAPESHHLGNQNYYPQSDVNRPYIESTSSTGV